MRANGYDPQCEALARHFLEGDTPDERIRELAQEIQDTVEGWLNDYEFAQEQAAKEGAP